MFNPASTMPVSNMRTNLSALANPPPFYAKGGHLAAIADYMSRLGQGDDKILAHIHPLEAQELEAKYGSSGENPHTGLPQYGRVLSKKITKQTKRWLPALGSLAGAAFLGPAGAIAGGGLGGALSGRRDAEGHRMFLPNVMRGLGTGAMIGGGQYLGQQMGIPGFGGLGSGNGAPVSQGVPSWSSGLPSPAAQPQGGGGGGGGLLGGIFGGGGGQNPGGSSIFSNPLNLALAGMAVAGHMGKRHKNTPNEQMHPHAQRVLNGNVDHPIPKMKPIHRRYVPLPEGYSADTHPEHSFFDEVNPPVEYYSQGGFVDGPTGGQDDLIDDHLEPNSYIVDASSTSDFGDGNSLAGAKKLDKFFGQQGNKKTVDHNYAPATKGMIPARISDGEYYISPEKVTALGGGDNNKGAKMIKKGIQKLRQEKRTGGPNLPKKAKPMDHYFGPGLKKPKHKFADLHDNYMRY